MTPVIFQNVKEEIEEILNDVSYDDVNDLAKVIEEILQSVFNLYAENHLEEIQKLASIARDDGRINVVRLSARKKPYSVTPSVKVSVERPNNTCDNCGAADGRCGHVIDGVCMNCYNTKKNNYLTLHPSLERTEEEVNKTALFLGNL